MHFRSPFPRTSRQPLYTVRQKFLARPAPYRQRLFVRPCCSRYRLRLWSGVYPIFPTGPVLEAFRFLLSSYVQYTTKNYPFFRDSFHAFIFAWLPDLRTSGTLYFLPFQTSTSGRV